MSGSFLVDPWGRRITTLRVSLTENCNFRCSYCSPEKILQSFSSSQYLQPEEIERFVRIASRLGIEKIRVTGGEPLLRKEILEILARIRSVPAVRDLSLTTNGSLLEPMLIPLRKAGLDRLNISLDSLDPGRFRRITGSDSFEKIYAAVFASLGAGFPVKLNIVALADLGEEEIVRLVNLAAENPLEVRFLEFMPLCGPGWESEKVLTSAQIREIVLRHFDLVPLPRNGAVAQSFGIGKGKGRVGFIGSLTESFCNECSRFRLSADGRIFPCLFSDVQVPVRSLLRAQAPDATLLDALREAARTKPKGNRFQEEPFARENFSSAGMEQTPFIRLIGG